MSLRLWDTRPKSRAQSSLSGAAVVSTIQSPDSVHGRMEKNVASKFGSPCGVYPLILLGRKVGPENKLLSLNYSILNRLLIFLLIIIIVVIILDNINSIYKYFLVEYILSVAELATASDL